VYEGTPLLLCVRRRYLEDRCACDGRVPVAVADAIHLEKKKKGKKEGKSREKGESGDENRVERE